MSTVKIKCITHRVARIRVVRKDFQYYWPYWKKFVTKYKYYKRPMGTRSLKVIEVKEDGGWRELGFTVPGTRQHPTKVNRIKIEFDKVIRPIRLCDRSIQFVNEDPTEFLHQMQIGSKYEYRDVNEYRRGDFRDTLPSGVVIDHNQALHLRVGQVVKKAQPLRLELGEECITDGYYDFPLTRPFGSQWRYSLIGFAQGISADNWPLFLKSIIGLPIHEVIETDRVSKQVRNQMRTIKKAKRDDERKKRIGQCFDGHKTSNAIAIGNNLIFILQKDDVLTYVVDSPEYASALYVFDDYDDARAWASRSIDWREARKRAKLFRIHRGNWKEEVDAVLA